MLNIILSIIGILVSGLGLWYAIKQVKGLKKITEEYRLQVHQEVMSAQDKIRDGLNISEVTMCIKNLESAIIYVRDGKIDLALLRMEDIETILHNNSLSEKYLSLGDRNRFKTAIEDYKDSLKSIMKNTVDENDLNRAFIIESLSSIRSYLAIIDNNIKDTLYGKGS